MTDEMRTHQLPEGDPLGDLFREAKSDLPAADALDSTWNTLALKISNTGPAAESVGAKGVTASGAKFGVGVVAATIAISAYMMSNSEEAIPRAPARVIVTAEEASTIDPMPAKVTTQTATLDNHSVARSGSEEASAITSGTIAETNSRPRSARTRRTRVRAARPAARAPNVELQPAPTVVPEVSRAEDPVESEARYLARAQRALGTNPHLTLQLVDGHRSLYPTGSLRQERDLLGIDALRRLGRHSLAAERVEAFLNRYPNSGHRTRLEAYLEAQVRPNVTP